MRHGRTCTEPEAVLRARLAQGHREVLVQWKGLPAAEATWTDLEGFTRIYPSFQLAEEGRDVMLDVQYRRWRKQRIESAGSATATQNAGEASG
jgi:hypothetical protein